MNAKRPVEPAMSDRDFADLNEGIRLYNAGQFWHAHEAWEDVWRRKSGVCDAFFKGMIQAAAAFHKMREGSSKGTRTHLERATAKLSRCPPAFLGVDVEAFLHSLQHCLTEATQGRFPVSRIPKITKTAKGYQG